MTHAPPTAGVAAPLAWLQLRDRFTNYLALDNSAPMRARLVAAIVDGSDDADIAALRANAFAERLGVAKVTSAVRSAVTTELRELYGAVAIDNYGPVATQFDEWATKFVAVAGQMDVVADVAFARHGDTRRPNDA
jgi:hypothetical protein